MKRSIFTHLFSAILSLGLINSSSVFAGTSSLPDKQQVQSTATQSVQDEVEKKAANEANEKRKKILADANAAIEETKQALQALDEKNSGQALAALERATGKLELILARDPALALAPVDVEVVKYDLLAKPDNVKKIINEAEKYLEKGEIQKARPLVANLASEIVIRSTNIPLATYPEAIKAITPLIDDGKLEEAKSGLQAALSTLVVTTDEVLPLPIYRAEELLEKAEALAENEERTVKENENLADMLTEARTQLKLAELLGYGEKKSFKPIYEQIEMIEDKVAGNEGGKGWFNRVKQQVSALF